MSIKDAVIICTWYLCVICEKVNVPVALYYRICLTVVYCFLLLCTALLPCSVVCGFLTRIKLMSVFFAEELGTRPSYVSILFSSIRNTGK